MIFVCNAVLGGWIVHFLIQNLVLSELLIFSKESLRFSKKGCNALKVDYTKVVSCFERGVCYEEK